MSDEVIEELTTHAKVIAKYYKFEWDEVLSMWPSIIEKLYENIPIAIAMEIEGDLDVRPSD